MVKQFKSKIKVEIDAINITTMSAKEKELCITALFALYVARGEDIVEEI